MRIQILSALALAFVLPLSAQANSAMAEAAFEKNREMLSAPMSGADASTGRGHNARVTVSGHSDAANNALQQVAQSTHRITMVMSGTGTLSANGQSAAASSALTAVNGG